MNCTLSNNSAYISGGGIEGSGTVTVTNSTLSNNSAIGGGGILNFLTLTVTNSTLSNNLAIDGGGILNDIDGTAILNNTIVANSVLFDVNNGGTLSGSHNLIETLINGGTNNLTDMLTSDPELGLLQDNGGPTFTHALASTSPAIDAGSNAVATAAGLTTDQRGIGFGRIADGDSNGTATVDIGAFEVADTTAPNAPTVTSPASATTVNADSFNITGTAEANSLVQVYSDANNNGMIDGADAVVASQQLTGGATMFSISTTLTQDAVNDFTVTAKDAAANESSPANVLRITEDSTAPNAPTVTSPAAATTVDANSFAITGTAEANSLALTVVADAGLVTVGALGASESSVIRSTFVGDDSFAVASFAVTVKSLTAS